MTEEIDRGWGVWCLTSPGWCCMQGGDPNTDEPWKGTRERADAVLLFVSRLNPQHRYELRRYSHNPDQWHPSALPITPRDAN